MICDVCGVDGVVGEYCGDDVGECGVVCGVVCLFDVVRWCVCGCWCYCGCGDGWCDEFV